MANAKDDARIALYTAITEEVEKMKAWDGTLNADSLELLARAYRALAGGAQPGGGCTCGSD